LNHRINYLKRSATINEIEAVVSLPKKKCTGSDGFSVEFYETFNKELIPAFLSHFHNVERAGTVPKSSCVPSIILMPKLDKDRLKGEL
jgi:hypothetical protein